MEKVEKVEKGKKKISKGGKVKSEIGSKKTVSFRETFSNCAWIRISSSMVH